MKVNKEETIIKEPTVHELYLPKCEETQKLQLFFFFIFEIITFWGLDTYTCSLP